MALPEIWLARHGETEWSKNGRHTGLTDIPLTERGREQAEALAALFAGVEFDLVLSSPMERARETARLCGLEADADERLTEWNYGSYEGLTTAEIHRQEPGWDLWTDGCPGGESVADVEQRLEPLLGELRERPGQRIALFGHGHCSRALAACWLDLGGRAGRVLKLDTATLSTMGTEHGRAVIERWNLAPRSP